MKITNIRTTSILFCTKKKNNKMKKNINGKKILHVIKMVSLSLLAIKKQLQQLQRLNSIVNSFIGVSMKELMMLLSS
jgi:hypothetical protein